MNKLSTIALTFAVTFALNSHIIVAQNTGNVIIGLLKSMPKKTVYNCEGEDLTDLLTEGGEQWIESIDCHNVDIIGGIAGIQLSINPDTGYKAFVQFNFKTSPLLVATNVSFYGNDKDNKNLQGTLLVNDQVRIPYNNDYFTLKSNIVKADAADILDHIEKGTGNLMPSRIFTTDLDNNNQITSCRLEFNSEEISDNIQIFALRIYYNDIIDDLGSSINELYNESNKTEIRYFDLQGRELTRIPETGVYLMKSNGKITKHIAH